jgi:3-isopropylmalate dehydrogenase
MRIVVLPGDGVGPEVIAQAVECLSLLDQAFSFSLTVEEHAFGGAAIDAFGSPLPEQTLAACGEADAILLGAVGGPKWDQAPERPEAGLLSLRAALGLYANLRPARTFEGLDHAGPLRPDIAKGADILVVRELTGGLYFGERREGRNHASDLCAYGREEIERVARIAFRAAQRRSGRVTSVDKANVLATSRLWRRTVEEVAAEFPDVLLNHLYVDAAAMALITRPRSFDVVLTENLFGDILSDELSVIGGSIGLLGSASIGDDRPALFEPIHGSAPDIAGQDRANPAGAIMSAAMLLDHLGHAEPAKRLQAAVEDTIRAGHLTHDLGGTTGCRAFGAKVREALSAALQVDVRAA